MSKDGKNFDISSNSRIDEGTPSRDFISEWSPPWEDCIDGIKSRGSCCKGSKVWNGLGEM